MMTKPTTASRLRRRMRQITPAPPGGGRGTWPGPSERTRGRPFVADKPYARVERHVQEVDQEIDNQDHHPSQEDEALHRRQVATLNRVDAQPPDARHVEDRLDE